MTVRLLHFSGLNGFLPEDIVALRGHLKNSDLHELDGILFTGLTKSGKKDDLLAASWLVKLTMTLFDLNTDQVVILPSVKDVSKGFATFSLAYRKIFDTSYVYDKPRIVSFDTVQLLAFNTTVTDCDTGVSSQRFQATLQLAKKQSRQNTIRIAAFHHPPMMWNFGQETDGLMARFAKEGALSIILTATCESWMFNGYTGIGTAHPGICHLTITPKRRIHSIRAKLIEHAQRRAWLFTEARHVCLNHEVLSWG